MPDLPSNLALADVPTGSEVISVTHRNNNAAVQAAVNALIAALSGGTSGQVLTATDADTIAWASGSAAGEELDYVAFTANVSPTATSEATANTVVTAAAVVFDGATDAIIEFFSPNVRPDSAAAGRSITVVLYEDGSAIGQMGVCVSPAGAASEPDNKPVLVRRRMTPASGSRTYSIRAFVSAGTGVVGAGAGGSGNQMPGYIRITRV